MTATMLTVQGNLYPAYATLEEAEEYLAPEADALVQQWTAASDEDKNKLLVRAARFISRLEFTQDADSAAGAFAVRLADANARYAAFLAAAPQAEDGSILVGGQGRVASISAGGVSIAYEQSQAKGGELQIAQSYDEIEAIRLGIAELGTYEILRPYLRHSRLTDAADHVPAHLSAPVVRFEETSLTQQLGIGPQDVRYDRASGRGAWPPSGTVLG